MYNGRQLLLFHYNYYHLLCKDYNVLALIACSICRLHWMARFPHCVIVYHRLRHLIRKAQSGLSDLSIVSFSFLYHPGGWTICTAAVPNQVPTRAHHTDQRWSTFFVHKSTQILIFVPPYSYLLHFTTCKPPRWSAFSSLCTYLVKQVIISYYLSVLFGATDERTPPFVRQLEQTSHPHLLRNKSFLFHLCDIKMGRWKLIHVHNASSIWKRYTEFHHYNIAIPGTMFERNSH